MKITVTIGTRDYRIDPAQGRDIAIPVSFGGRGVTAFGAAHANAAPYTAEGFTGDVAKGGSCNCSMVHFSPHLHGTHTEGVGHIAKDFFPVTAVMPESFVAATLVSIAPQEEDGEKLITKQALETALKDAEHDFLDALVIRTLPNGVEKRSHNYDGKEIPPYFTGEAMAYILMAGVRHLLVDLPSIDRMDDGGALENHRIFWNVPDGVSEISPAMASENTVTELIYVPDDIRDGRYILNLQLAAFAADAAPSRPVLYEVTE